MLTKCQACSPGQASNVAAAKACTKCKDGTVAQSGASECEKCPNGKTNNKDLTTCDLCDLGKFGDAASGCQDCPTGWNQIDKGKTSCVKCKQGEKDVGTVQLCQNCEVGRYGSNAGVCQDCTPGMYADGKGQTSCVNCPVDSYLSEPGASAKAECALCTADRSTGAKVGSTNSSVCLCKRTAYYRDVKSECVKCPLGGDCSAHDGLTLNQVVALPGYWRANATTDIFTDCKVAFSASLNASADAYARCIGGSSGSGSTSNFNPDDQCVLGSGGPSCMACIDGYVMIGSKCAECQPSMLNVVGAVAGLMVLLFVIFALVFIKAKEPKEEEDEQKAKKGCCGGKKKTAARKEKKETMTKEGKMASTRDKGAV